MQTIAALSRQGVEATLVLPCAPGKVPNEEAIKAYYKVQGSFRIEGFAQPFTTQSDARKLYHALFARRRARGSDVLYTRNFPALFAAASAAMPFAYETYRPWFDQFRVLRPMFRASLNRPHCLGAVLHSSYAAARYASLRVSTDRLLVAHNGYDPEMVRRAGTQSEARQALGLSSARPIVAYTGHVNATKGIDSIIQLAKRVPRALFLLVGHDGKAGMTEWLAKGVENITLVPWQAFDRVALYLAAADVLLLPPSNRGLAIVGNTVLPMKLFQYLAAARPILAPRTPDVVELLRDGENARLVDIGDVPAFAQALERLLDDQALRERLSQGARASSAELTWDARAKKLAAFLELRLRKLAT
jgi:glycosyltransferase involved in cell wall biosynthesis